MKHCNMRLVKKHPESLGMMEKCRYFLHKRYLIIGLTKKGVYAELLTGSKRTPSVDSFSLLTGKLIANL